jgi:hypothetical protein
VGDVAVQSHCRVAAGGRNGKLARSCLGDKMVRPTSMHVCFRTKGMR